MSNWRPSSSVDAAHRRAAMLERVRTWFKEQDVLAVDTPALSSFATSDPNIDNISVRVASKTAFLHTSPESSMKCLLADGYPDIYSVCRVFRDGEKGRHHLPEFTLIEWYRRRFSLSEIVSDTTSLIACCLERPALGTEFEIRDYTDVMRDMAGIDVFDATIADLAAVAAADNTLRDSLGDDRDAWLDLILAMKVAAGFATDRLTVLQHYPRSQAALARTCPDDDRVADRFEVFYGTLELANGYVELTDAAEQRDRFVSDMAERKDAGKAATTPDEFLLAALGSGLPDCAGVAVGFERLQMIYDQTDNIDKVVTFSSRIDDD